MNLNGLRINYPQHYDSQQPTATITSNDNTMASGAMVYNTIQNDGYSPLFQRIGHQDYAEIQNCHVIIDSLQQRVHNLEVINLKLEKALETEAKTNIQLERQCEIIETNWKAKCDSLETDIDTLKKACDIEKMKNERLREHLSRTERELYSILQRKYELMRGGGGPNVNNNVRMNQGEVKESDVRGRLSPSWESSLLKPGESNGIDDMHVAQQVRPPKDLRQKKVVTNLAEFFGL